MTMSISGNVTSWSSLDKPKFHLPHMLFILVTPNTLPNNWLMIIDTPPLTGLASIQLNRRKNNKRANYNKKRLLLSEGQNGCCRNDQRSFAILLGQNSNSLSLVVPRLSQSCQRIRRINTEHRARVHWGTIPKERTDDNELATRDGEGVGVVKGVCCCL